MFATQGRFGPSVVKWRSTRSAAGRAGGCGGWCGRRAGGCLQKSRAPQARYASFMAKEKEPEMRQGPRDGKTTVTKGGLIRTVIYPLSANIV